MRHVAHIVFLLDSNVLVEAFALKSHFLGFNSSDTVWDLTSSVGIDGVSLVAGDQDKDVKWKGWLKALEQLGPPSAHPPLIHGPGGHGLNSSEAPSPGGRSLCWKPAAGHLQMRPELRDCFSPFGIGT